MGGPFSPPPHNLAGAGAEQHRTEKDGHRLGLCETLWLAAKFFSDSENQAGPSSCLNLGEINPEKEGHQPHVLGGGTWLRGIAQSDFTSMVVSFPAFSLNNANRVPIWSQILPEMGSAGEEAGGGKHPRSTEPGGSTGLLDASRCFLAQRVTVSSTQKVSAGFLPGCLTTFLIPGAVGITLSGFLSHPSMGCLPQGRLNVGYLPQGRLNVGFF